MKQKQWPVKEQQRLKAKYGEWAVVTGASSGIGLELATQCAEAGIHLIINGRNVDSLQAAKTTITTGYGVEIEIVDADVGTGEGIEKIISAANKVDVGLFIAAAGFGTSGLFLESKPDEETSLLRVNCEAVLRLTHYFSRLFAQQQRGGIIFLSSIVAFQGVPYSANYAASKAYVQSFAEALATELKPFNVDVLAAAPGPVASGFGQRARMQMNRTLRPTDVGVAILKALGRKTTSLPGLLTKILAYSLKTLPRQGKVAVMGKVMAGFTSHQKAERW